MFDHEGNNYETESMYRTPIELWKHTWKFGRKKNAVVTQATGEFPQTFMSVSIT